VDPLHHGGALRHRAAALLPGGRSGSGAPLLDLHRAPRLGESRPEWRGDDEPAHRLGPLPRAQAKRFRSPPRARRERRASRVCVPDQAARRGARCRPSTSCCPRAAPRAACGGATPSSRPGSSPRATSSCSGPWRSSCIARGSSPTPGTGPSATTTFPTARRIRSSGSGAPRRRWRRPRPGIPCWPAVRSPSATATSARTTGGAAGRSSRRSSSSSASPRSASARAGASTPTTSSSSSRPWCCWEPRRWPPSGRERWRTPSLCSAAACSASCSPAAPRPSSS
jgi:hypothetical protein